MDQRAVDAADQRVRERLALPGLHGHIAQARVNRTDPAASLTDRAAIEPSAGPRVGDARPAGLSVTATPHDGQW